MYSVKLWNKEVTIQSIKSIFSPNRLDKGTEFMLSKIQISPTDKILDLGCGSGIVGISIAKNYPNTIITMVDIDDDSIKCSKNNILYNEVSNIQLIKSDGFSKIEDKNFSLILSNPPYHTDFSVAKNFIENGKKHLLQGGKFFLVVKRLDWYKNKMKSVFGGVKIFEDNGYFVLISEKRDNFNKSKMKKQKIIKKKHLKKLNNCKY